LKEFEVDPNIGINFDQFNAIAERIDIIYLKESGKKADDSEQSDSDNGKLRGQQSSQILSPNAARERRMELLRTLKTSLTPKGPDSSVKKKPEKKPKTDQNANSKSQFELSSLLLNRFSLWVQRSKGLTGILVGWRLTAGFYRKRRTRRIIFTIVCDF
jgi:hypothetical protein